MTRALRRTFKLGGNRFAQSKKRKREEFRRECGSDAFQNAERSWKQFGGKRVKLSLTTGPREKRTTRQEDPGKKSQLTTSSKKLWNQGRGCIKECPTCAKRAKKGKQRVRIQTWLKEDRGVCKKVSHFANGRKAAPDR